MNIKEIKIRSGEACIAVSTGVPGVWLGMQSLHLEAAHFNDVGNSQASTK